MIPIKSRMGARKSIVVAASAGLTLGTLALGAVPSPASAAQAPAGNSPDSATESLSTRPGKPIPRPDGFTANDRPGAVARAFVAQRRKSLDAERSVTVTSVQPSSQRGHVVRMQQSTGGVPILGGEVVVDLDKKNNVRSAASESLPGKAPSLSSAVSAKRAGRTAVTATAKTLDVPAGSLRAAKATKWVYHPSIIGAPGIPRASLVWRTEVTSPADPGVRQLVLVDAKVGAVRFTTDLVNHALNRQICNANNTQSKVPCVAPFSRVEGQGNTGDGDVDKAYIYSGDTYNFFKNRFNRDSLNNAGMTLKSTVRYCDNSQPCPFANAFWNGEQMVYGQSYASADDVVGHELTHGVTDFTSELFYYYQSGAINEALSDIFGEFIDLKNGKGNDSPAVRWRMGEDLPIGAIRDMKNPAAFGDPATTDSPNYYGGLSDSGGVHTNSGVFNKFAFLITDGQTFNGQTVTGLGLDKAAKIIYGANQRLTSASDFRGLATALKQSCSALVGTIGITPADCTEVAQAIMAVKMGTPPPSAPTQQAPACAAGQTVQTIWSDGFENPAAGQWARNNFGDYRFIYTAEPYGIRYATAGKSNLWAPSPGFTNTGMNMTRTANWNNLPAGAMLRFMHAYEFEYDSGGNYDGAVIEYSTNNGGTWVNAGPLIVSGKYNGMIYGGASSNPLKNRQAFTKVSKGYTATKLNLAPLAGQNVRFRFRSGNDQSVGWYGWFIDDMRLYRCT